jgi:hypothetical protein
MTGAAHTLHPNGLHTVAGGHWNAQWLRWILEHPEASDGQILD